MREGGWGAGRLGGWWWAHLSLSITYLQRSHLCMRDGCSCRPECAGVARLQGASCRLPPGAQSPATGMGRLLASSAPLRQRRPGARGTQVGLF